MNPCFRHRSCYVNFAEHVQNTWNYNPFSPGPDAPNQWSETNWWQFLVMLKAFGYTCFEYWAPPTFFAVPALAGDGIYGAFAASMRRATEIAHFIGLQTKCLAIVNCLGPDWYFACPHTPDDHELILKLWRHWIGELRGTDIFGIFPGDPGGCNRNGCTHETYVDLALEITGVVKAAGAVAEIGTWGTPFSGWGADMITVEGWQGDWKTISDPRNASANAAVGSIWNGTPDRARLAMDYLLKRLPEFPTDTMVAINLGFSPDGDALNGGDARGYAREIAQVRAITSWDYSVAEGELICYPHWRLPRMAARRREEWAAAPYAGGMIYTMTPRLNILSLYAGGQFFLDPDADPDRVSRTFCTEVFGEGHAALGELLEAFEVVPGWGYYPRRRWSKEELRRVYTEIIDRLESADPAACRLPLFPDVETYRQDLLWFARAFREMAGPSPDRDRIRLDYRRKVLAIYDFIPEAADERTALAAQQFSDILGG